MRHSARKVVPVAGISNKMEINGLPRSARDPRGVALWMLVILALSVGVAGVILYADVVWRVWR